MTPPSRTAVNFNELTFAQWVAAAAVGQATQEHLAAWQRGEDPSDWRAQTKTGAAEEVAHECGCPHRHTPDDKTVRPCETAAAPMAAMETAPVIYEEKPAKKSRKKKAAEVPGPLASAAGSAVGGMVAAALVAEESADCISWTKIGADPDARAACVEMAKKIGPIDNARKVYDLLHKEFAKRDQETFVVVPLDVRGQLRSRPIEVAYGQRSRVSVGVADIMRAAVVSGAEAIAISHAHPSGAARPSKADRDLTKAVEEACGALGGEILMVDHVVVGHQEFFSIKENRLYKVEKASSKG